MSSVPKDISFDHFGRFALENADQAVLLIDAPGQIRYANPAACTLLEHPLEALYQKHIAFFLPSPSPEWSQTIARLQQERRLQLPICKPERLGPGKRLELRLQLFAHQQEPLAVGYLSASVEQQSSEPPLSESEAKFRTLAETASAGIFILAGQSFLFCNRATEELSGYSRQELEQMSFLDLVHPEDRHLVSERALARLRGEAVPSRYEIRVITKDGQERWIAITGSKIILREGPAIIGTAFDITERKAAELKLQQINQELIRANDELKTLDQLKENLISNISHELRTPVVTIQGYAEMIAAGRAGPISETQQRYLRIALRSVQHLMELIDQLLSHSRLALRQTILALNDVELTTLTREGLEFISPRAQKKQLQLALEAPDEPLWGRCDRAKLGQVVLNLLDNAVKFTPPGQQITVQLAAGLDGLAWISVADRGIGIPPEQLDRIFDRFYQGDPSATRRYRGLGIGLAISKEIIELHGGRIEAQSEPGYGSIFRVGVPLALPVASAREAPQPPRRDEGDLPVAPEAQPRCVLLVDDDPDVLALLQLLLSSSGYTPLAASDTASARELLEREPVDLLLLDIAMPDRDGLDFLDELKATPGLAEIPVMMLTARAESSVRERALRLGAVGFILKPVQNAQLLELIAQALHDPPSR